MCPNPVTIFSMSKIFFGLLKDISKSTYSPKLRKCKCKNTAETKIVPSMAGFILIILGVALICTLPDIMDIITLILLATSFDVNFGHLLSH